MKAATMKQGKVQIRPFRRIEPYHVYSSHNKRGGRTHPHVARMRNRVLDLWAEMADYDTISELTNASITAIKSYIRRARILGDPRAVRPFRDRKIQRAVLRRKQMREMHAAGMTARQIADRLDCTVRLVEIRLKEMV